MRIIKIIFINLITFVVLLAIVNWACGYYLKKNSGIVSRHTLPNYNDNREMAREIFKDYNSVQHQYEPFVGWKCLPYQGKTLTISSQGERVNKKEVVPSVKYKQVHFFGGSTMWGEGSDDPNTIPSLFHAANASYQVYNHAQLAYNTRQELDALISLYSKNVKPDIVIFYDGVNDAAFLCPKEIKELPAHRLVPMYREKLYASSSAAIKELSSKIFFSNIVKVVNKFTNQSTRENSPYDCLSNPEKAEQIAEIMMKNWELAHELVTNRGGKFYAFLQPAAYIGKPRIDHLDLDEKLGKNFVAVYNHLKRKIKERNHPWIFDISDRFDGQEYFYIDFCHVSPNGNRIIAREISSVVNPSNLSLYSR